jgi:heme A synthase
MAGVSLECILMLAYALALALNALVLEWVAGHAHRRSLRVSTAGFTYHPDRDIWRCPRDQHLFPVFSDSLRGTVIYRAPASACNACPSKAACTDSNHGREIERNLADVEHGMKRIHRAFSFTLLVLASVILVVELFRSDGIYARTVLIIVLILFCGFIWRLGEALIATRMKEAE